MNLPVIICLFSPDARVNNFWIWAQICLNFIISRALAYEAFMYAETRVETAYNTYDETLIHLGRF